MDETLVSADGKNSRAVLCQRCGCRVLSAGMATLAKRELREASGRVGQLPLSPSTYFILYTEKAYPARGFLKLLRGCHGSVEKLLLPSMKKKSSLAEDSSPDCELLVEHWLVHDMFTFENVGFTKDVGSVKFLVCADCEVGPIGWHSLEEKSNFYVALERVRHE